MKTLSVKDIKQVEIKNSKNEAINRFEILFKSDERTITLEGKGRLRSLSSVR